MLNGPKTLGRLLKQKLDKYSDRYALGWIENNEVKSLTFKEYANTLEILSNSFYKLGVHVGDKIAILGQTSKEWHLLDLATLMTRACTVPIYPSYVASEVQFIFNHSDSVVLIVENDTQMEKVIPILKDLTSLRLIISIQDLTEETL